MTHHYDWRNALTKEERTRIAQRGPIDCRKSTDCLDDVVPCRNCHCWLVTAFKHARTEKVHERRRLRLHELNNPHGVTDGHINTIWASDTSGRPGVDWLLMALKQVHPERDPHPEVKLDMPEDEDANVA